MLDSPQPKAKPRTNRLCRRSSAYMAIMNVTALAPKAVSTGRSLAVG